MGGGGRGVKQKAFEVVGGPLNIILSVFFMYRKRGRQPHRDAFSGGVQGSVRFRGAGGGQGICPWESDTDSRSQGTDSVAHKGFVGPMCGGPGNTPNV